jgi:hypothetical protein
VKQRKSDAFDIRESQMKGAYGESYADLALWLSRELDTGLETRGDVTSDIRYGWTLYEQGRTRLGTNAPWPDAADLTSPYASEYVDALHARVMQTVFTEPVFTVEGWGDSSARAPFVEEFHQRAQEDERLQGYLDEVLLRSWIEPAGILEVSESFELRRERQRKRVKIQTDEFTGGPVMGEDNQPVLQTNPETDEYLESEDPNEPSADVDVDVWEPVRMGPAYDVVPYLDFLTLPAHARNNTQIWGYAKRFWRRVPELKARVQLGVYDKHAVEEIGEENERQTLSDEAPETRTVPSQLGPLAQKELWEIQFLADLDGQGERWWRATVHKDKRQLLRLKYDDRTTRYLRFVPFPKPGSVDGYSLVTHKLITIIEQDTAVRNMWADRAALAAAVPLKRQTGALWDPYEQPFGPRAVIDVRDMNEIQPMEMPDVPNSITQWKQDIRADADRLIGQNDTSLGTQTEEHRTLGEVQLRAGYAEVRTDLIVKRFKEPLEELGQARHNIYKRQLAGRAQGLPMPQSMVFGLEARGIDVQSLSTDGRITADMLEGQFWFKPRGSVESADRNRQKSDFNQLMQALPGLMQANTMIAAIFQSQPAAKSIVEQMLRVYNWPDKQAFLGSEAQGLMGQQAQMQSPQMQVLMQMAQMGGGAGTGPSGGALPPGESPAPPAQNPMGIM